MRRNVCLTSFPPPNYIYNNVYALSHPQKQIFVLASIGGEGQLDRRRIIKDNIIFISIYYFIQHFVFFLFPV